MIRKAEDMASEIREGMRGGKGKIQIDHIFKNDEFKGKARLCARITLEPGASIGFHEHKDEDEIYHFISGKGIVNDDGKEHELTAGDSVLTCGGNSHSVENTGNGPLVFLAVILLH